MRERESILTGSQRDRISNLDTAEYTHQHRRRISARVAHGTKDLQMLATNKDKLDIDFSETNPSITQENVTSAIAFYLGVLDDMGGSTEDVLSQAISKYYATCHPDNTVVSTISIESEPRIDAAKRGQKKSESAPRLISPIEAKALNEVTREMKEADLRDIVLSNLDIIEENINDRLELVEIEPQSPAGSRPDILAEGSDGLIIVEVTERKDDTTRQQKQLNQWISEYGGPGNARGVLVTPKSIIDIDPQRSEHDRVHEEEVDLIEEVVFSPETDSES